MGYDLGNKGRVHSFFTGGMVDGPGIRSVVFLAGCNLRCKYCHNPDTWQMLRGDEMTVGEVLDEVLKYKSYYKFSGGGVTLSGGEPMLQARYLTDILAACRDHGIHTTLDTSGSASRADAEKILAHTSLLLLDIKTINPELYFELTKVSLEKTIGVLDVAKEMDVPTWIRFVLVPGITDDREDIKNLAEFLRGYDNVTNIEVLPFHKNGEYKWQDLKIPYELNETEPPSMTEVREVEDLLKGSMITR